MNFLEFHKLIDLINIKGNKLFLNVKIQWIYMLFLTKMYVECHLLIINLQKNEVALKKLIHYVVLNSFRGCLVSYLCLNVCIFDKICTRSRCVYLQLCGHYQVGPPKVVQALLWYFTNYEDPTFDDFNFLFILSNDTFPMNWFSNFNGGKEEMYLAFLFVGGKYTT